MACHGVAVCAGILRDADDAYLDRSLAWVYCTLRYVTLNVVLCVPICIVLLTQWVLLFVFLEQQQQQHNQKPSATSPFNPFPKNKNSFQMHDSCE